MSEEINKHAAELNNTPPQLNEATLEGVSGGSYGPDPGAKIKAKHYCGLCDHNGFCGYDSVDLAYHIESRGDPGSYTNCPYYKP